MRQDTRVLVPAPNGICSQPASRDARAAVYARALAVGGLAFVVGTSSVAAQTQGGTAETPAAVAGGRSDASPAGASAGSTSLAQDEQPPAGPSGRAPRRGETESGRAASAPLASAGMGEALADPDGEDEDPFADIDDRIDELAGRPGADRYVRPVLLQARRALTRARELFEQGQLRPAERAKQIANAALTLAARRLAHAREREATRDIQQRVDVAERRARAARQALVNAMEQRAALLRAQREGRAAPAPTTATGTEDED